MEDFTHINEKPCLFDTGQGFSVLYNNRYLYSRVNPAGVIERIVAQLNIRENTLILCFSPLLGYGIPSLLKKLPPSCMILAVEQNSELAKFTIEHIADGCLPQKNTAQFYFLHTSSLIDINTFLQSSAVDISKFRRCISLDMSGGTLQNVEFYRSVVAFADNSISQFWKNRMTLTKLGRLFSRNLFKNLQKLPFSTPFVFGSIHAPILICGAGPSLDATLDAFLCSEQNKTNTISIDEYYIIAVDTALMPLLKRGIIPDAVIVVESQLAIEQAFIGAKNTKITLFADLTSRSSIPHITGGTVQYFFSEFAHMGFIEKLKEQHILPPLIPPLGSVGVAAVYIGVALRSCAHVPLFFTGLDFSYTAGKTHAKETPAHHTMLQNCTRLCPVGNPASAYRDGSFVLTGKKLASFICDPSLSLYGQLFYEHFSAVEHIFDIGITGMNIGCLQCDFDDMKKISAQYASSVLPQTVKTTLSEPPPAFEHTLQERITSFYQNEREGLQNLIQAIADDADDGIILSLLENREYLYIHFPDGHLSAHIQLNSPSKRGFLKRIQTECSFFLKDMSFTDVC